MTAILSVLEPITVTSTILSQSTAVENDYPAYSAATGYGVGALCVSLITHRIYESAIINNQGNDPTLIANLSGATPKWLDIGPTNAWAMFDGEANTQTAVTSPLTVVLRPGFASSLYLAALDADDVEITVKDAPGGEVVFHDKWTLEGSSPGDYDEYFWAPFKPQTDFIVRGVDPFFKCEWTITLTKASGLVKCGILAIGDLVALGRTLSDAKAKPKSYSYIKTDDFGRTSIKRRNPATDMECSALVDRSEANAVLSTLRRLQDVPCAWIASDSVDFAGLRCFGLGSGDIKYSNAEKLPLSLNVQGLI
jgi:hypothetical protein